MPSRFSDLKYPFVALIEGIPEDDVIALKLADGRRFTFDVSEIKGFTDRLAELQIGKDAISFNHWCEIGQHNNGQLYVEIILTSKDFDAYHQDKRIGKSITAYNEWKYKHKVPIEISPHYDLYYDSLFKGQLS